jgi:hypothetical protein
MRCAVYIVLFILVFAFTTFSNRHGNFAFGLHSFSSYGWPRAWLHVHSIEPTVGKQATERKIDWQPFVLSAGVSAVIAWILSMPIFFWSAKKSKPD